MRRFLPHFFYNNKLYGNIKLMLFVNKTSKYLTALRLIITNLTIADNTIFILSKHNLKF